MHPYTTLAIEAFEKVEKIRLQLEKAERELQRTIRQFVPESELTEYYLATEQIRRNYEDKAIKAGF